MRTYQIYLIEEEFAHHFFGRERIFYNLFSEYMDARGALKNILKKQIDCVTKKIGIERLQQEIHQQMKQKKNFRLRNGGNYIEKINGYSNAAITFHSAFIIIEAEGDYEAETAFFECLRKCNSSFLALDFRHERFGWLKPIKERKFV